jgi:hypothetical protein
VDVEGTEPTSPPTKTTVSKYVWGLSRLKAKLRYVSTGDGEK